MLLIVIVAFLGLYGILTAVSCAFARTQTTQYSAQLWDEDGGSAMVSVFMQKENALSLNDIPRLEYNLDNLLVAEAMEAPAENARLYVASFSRAETISLSTNKGGSVTCTAFGVEGDFFRFHPYELISGCYLQEETALDGVVLDEEAAWKLFGAIEVDGMELTYNGTVYTVVGVVKPEDGYMAKAGGAVGGTVFLPLRAFSDAGATCCEIIFPNPVTGFAKKQVKQAFASSGFSEENIVLVNNSERYGFSSCVKRLGKWNRRGMAFREIAFPYWENSAIAVENIVDLFMLFRLVFAVPPIIMIIIMIICFHPLHRLKLLAYKLADKIRR